ncbi:hypothetical protein ACSSV4_004499 [Roseovarius sp. MBR-154]
MFAKEEAEVFVEANQAHVSRLRKTITNLMTMRHVLYFLDRLDGLKHDARAASSKDSIMEAEAFMTTVVISYGRLFAESKGVPVFKKKLIPKDLFETHDEIIKFRNERYAHHGCHVTTAAEIELFVGESDVDMKLHWRASMYNGAPPHWRDLFEWVDEFLKTSFKKQVAHLSATSGKEWLPFEPDMDFESITIDETDKLDLPPLIAK